MSETKDEICWGKLNPLLAWKTFQDLREKGQLSLEDCRGCKLTLENTHLNILGGLVNEFDYDIQWIEDRMSEVEVSIIEIENTFQVNPEKIEKLACQRCTMKSELCQFKLCRECCRRDECTSHNIRDFLKTGGKNNNYWKDHLSDDEDQWSDKPICQKCRREPARPICQNNFCRDCCHGVCIECFSANQREEKEAQERKELLSHVPSFKKKKKYNDQKETWADALFGKECPTCGNSDLYDSGQFKSYCYVCKKNVK